MRPKRAPRCRATALPRCRAPSHTAHHVHVHVAHAAHHPVLLLRWSPPPLSPSPAPFVHLAPRIPLPPALALARSGVRRSGPVWLEDLRLLIVRFIGLVTGMLLIPMLDLTDTVFHCEFGVGSQPTGESTGEWPSGAASAASAASAEEAAMLIIDLGGLRLGAETCERLPDVKYWVVAWEHCMPCFEGTQLVVSSLAGLAIATFLLIALRLSTLFQDVSLLDLIPATGGSVLRSHLLESWRNESVPSAGPFTRDARYSWLFNLNQTAAKVVIVLISGHLRHHTRILQGLRILLGVWLVAMGLVFRPYASRRFCRLQVTLKSVVLNAYSWSALVSAGTALGGDRVRDVLSLCFVLSLAPVAHLTYAASGLHFAEEPSRPSVSRSYALAKALVIKLERLAVHSTIRALQRRGSDRSTSLGKRTTSTKADAGDKLKMEAQNSNSSGGLASFLGAASIDLIA